jgi:hypothetical protein
MYFLPLVFPMALAGCAGKLKMALAGSLIQDVALATAKQEDVDLAAQAAPTYLLLLEGLLESNPRDQRLLLALAEGYTSYGALVESNEPERARLLYRRARDWGQQALARRKKIAPLLKAPYPEFVRITDHLEAGDVPTVFWAASAWGAWISASTHSMAALAELPKVIHLMEWVLQQDETFQYGSPHLFLGVYHATLPKMLGGDPEKAAFHFDRALQISRGQALMVYVLKARFYARQVFDRKLYESLLHQALKQPVDSLPQLSLQNAAAQAQARKLLEEIDAFF